MLQDLDRTPAVKHLLIINIIVFIIMNFLPQIGQHYDTFALYYFDSPDFGIWQIISHMFLHANLNESFGLMHISFNMYMLYQFGTLLEKHWGTKKFVIFYFVSGLGAAFLYTANLAAMVQYAYHTILPFSTGNLSYLPSAVGASGAIAGLMVAFALLHPNTKMMLMFIPVPIKAKYLIGGFFAYDLIMGLKISLSAVGIIPGAGGDGIAHFAHLGGALAGFIILKIWQKSRKSFY